MSNHHFHQSVGPFTVLFFYDCISIRFQAKVFASRVATPECRTTIFTSRPDRLRFYYFTISFPFGSRQRFLHRGSRNLNVEPPFQQSAGPFTILLFYDFISIRFQAEVFASRVAKPECRTTIFTSRPDRLRLYFLLFHFHSVSGRGFCIAGRET